MELGETIGEGQFGDVHKGSYRSNKDGHIVAVAIKTCKPDADLATAEKFLEEACEHFLTLNRMKLISVKISTISYCRLFQISCNNFIILT